MAVKARQSLLLGSLLTLAMLVIAVIVVHQYLTEPFPGHNDFMSRWEGARSFWVDGLNPYGEQASLNIQQQIYGRPVQAGEDPGYFAYPFYTLFLVWPLVYLPYAWASAIWMVLLAACLISSLFLLFDLFGWKPAVWSVAVLMIWVLAFYYSARGLILGQPGLFVYWLEVLALWAIVRQRDNLAGVALALSTLKPQMGFLIVPFILLWALRYRRWRLLIAFTATMLLLLGASFLLQPGWLGDWLAQLGLYPSYTALGSPVWIIVIHYLGLPSISEWIAAAFFVGVMLWGWWLALRPGLPSADWSTTFLWAAVLTLTITHLIAPRTATPHYVVFIIPLIALFAVWSRRHRRQANLWIGLTLMLSLIVPWLHFLITLEGRFEHPTVYLPLPFLALALLLLLRRAWWKEAVR